jgi:hypothetical protein
MKTKMAKEANLSFRKKIRESASRHWQSAIDHCPLISREVSATGNSYGEQQTMFNSQ